MRPGRMRNGASWSAARRGALVSVGWRGGTRAGFCWPADAVAPAEERSARHSWRALRTCALETLALWAFHPTRLETRTKESNMYASRWVANPRRRK